MINKLLLTAQKSTENERLFGCIILYIVYIYIVYIFLNHFAADMSEKAKSDLFDILILSSSMRSWYDRSSRQDGGTTL